MSKVIKDNRHAGYVKHGVRDMLKQRIDGIAAGYEDINDHDQLCHAMTWHFRPRSAAKLNLPADEQGRDLRTVLIERL